MKVMLVDDSVTMLKILRNHLKDLFITDIEEAQDGQQAIYRLLSMKKLVDVIFLDWDMPNTNGYQCLEMIRQHPKLKHIKIIMCTAVSEKQKIIQAIKMGANNYIIKPVTLDLLKTKLKDIGVI